MQINVAMMVTDVTVYPDRARVVCQGEVAAEIGTHSFIIEELPLTLEPDSVRTAGRGSAEVRLLGVDVSKRNYVQTPTTTARALETEIERGEDALRVIQDERGRLQEHAQYLAGMRAATMEYAKGLALGRSTVEDQVRLVGFLQEQDQELRNQIRELDFRQRGLEQALKKLRQDLAQLQSLRPLQRYEIKVEAEVRRAGNFSLELSYVVNQASWKPLYDLRLQDDGKVRQLALTAIAQVQQQTGQDWNGITLTLSTARPALNQQLPELRAWYIDAYTPPPVMLAAAAPAPQAIPRGKVMRAAMHEGGAAVEETAFLSLPDKEAETSVANVVDAGTSVQFIASHKSDIPSDGSPRKTTLGQFELDPQLDYLIIPKHTDSAFRRLTMKNNTVTPFLAGPVNLFVNEEFIGTTQMNYTPRNEEMKLLLGVEDRLKVKRELIRRTVDKQFLRDNRSMSFGYEIELHNLMNAEAKVELQDQIPVSRHENIKVRLDRFLPEPQEKTDLHLYKWFLTVQTGQKLPIRYEFTVEHPRHITVTGLNI